jgi:hypothetical protein
MTPGDHPKAPRRGAAISPQPFKHPRPCRPTQQHERIGVVSPKKTTVVFAEPLLKRDEPAAVLARFAFEHGRGRVIAVQIEVNVVAGPAKTRSTRQGIALGLDPKLAVAMHELNLHTVALPAMSRAAHGSNLARG